MSAETPTNEEVIKVRRYECSMRGHSWDVIESVGVGPVKVLCSRCGEDSGLRRISGSPEE